MTDPETLLITEYYRGRLARWENRDLDSVSTGKLEAAAEEASCLRKLLDDYREEGLDEMIAHIVGETDAERRLADFLERALARLGPPGERQRFFLFPEPVESPVPGKGAFEGGEVWDLDEYILRLEDAISGMGSVERGFAGPAEAARWRAKTEVLMEDMVCYLLWLWERLRSNRRLQPVVLLRDTLVIHLGMRLLRRRGEDIPEPRALVFNRAFANAFGPPESIYEELLVEGLCRVVHEDRPQDPVALGERFSERALGELALPEAFVAASRKRLGELELEAAPLFVESGVNGTFPNWLLALHGGAGEMSLYSTAPWLYGMYAPIVFRRNYNWLREMETIVAHEHLFQVTDAESERWRIQETTDPVARELATYELGVFIRILEERLGKG